MDDMNWTLPPELESALEDYHSAPQPDPAFASRLDLELRRRFDEIPLPLKVERMSFMQTLRARPLVAILVAILALLLLSGVAYAIGRLSGFIPGFGFTSDAGAVTVLKETVSAESNGITISVEKAVSDRSRFWVEVGARGISAGQDSSQAFILLPSGEQIQFQMGNTNSDAGAMRMTYIFPALTGNPQRVTLLIENLSGENFSLPFELRPIRAGEILPVPPTESAPLQSETHDGLTLVLDTVAPDKDKTIFQVSLRFDQEGVWLNSDWYEVDSDGWVLRNLTTHHDANGKIIQQAATIGNYSINFTTGDTFTDNPPYRFSLDMLTQSLAQAAQYNAQVLREETTCEDGSPCLLITLLDSFSQPMQNPGEAQTFGGSGNRTWINLQSGQQVKFEWFWVMSDGQERVDSTRRTLLVEKVLSAPQDVLDFFAKVVAP